MQNWNLRVGDKVSMADATKAAAHFLSDTTSTKAPVACDKNILYLFCFTHDQPLENYPSVGSFKMLPFLLLMKIFHKKQANK